MLGAVWWVYRCRVPGRQLAQKVPSGTLEPRALLLSAPYTLHLKLTAPSNITGLPYRCFFSPKSMFLFSGINHKTFYNKKKRKGEKGSRELDNQHGQARLHSREWVFFQNVCTVYTDKQMMLISMLLIFSTNNIVKTTTNCSAIKISINQITWVS